MTMIMAPAAPATATTIRTPIPWAMRHVHAPKNFGMAFAIGIGLNVGFVVIEALYGFLGNSVALLADAGHNLSDVLGLGVAWLASELVKRDPDPALLLWPAQLVDPRRSVQRGLPARHRRRDFAGGDPAPRRARARRRPDGDDRRGHRHRGQRDHRLAVRLRRQVRHQPARRLPAHGVRRAGLGGRRAGGPRDPADGLALARPRRQPDHQRPDHLGHMGPAARVARHVDGGGAGPYRPRQRSASSWRDARASRRSTTCISGR